MSPRVPFLILVLLVSGFSAFAPTGAAKGFAPTLQISQLTPNVQQVVVTPSAAGTAFYTGTVTVTKPPGAALVVHLESTTDIGWIATVSPPDIPFTLTGGSSPISITVNVPPAENASSVGVVTVTGTAKYDGLQLVGSSTGVAKVVQYFRIIPDSVTAFVQLNPGYATDLRLEIINRGNGLDTFSLSFPNLGDLAGDGWIIVLQTPSVDNVGPGTTAKVKIPVQSPRPWITYQQGEAVQIVIRITSENAQVLGGPPVFKDYLFTVYLRGPYIDLVAAILLPIIFAVLFVGGRSLIRQRRARRGQTRPPMTA